MKRIFLLGECMVELRRTNSNTMHQSFAGDVYNTAVYLKRCFNDIDVNLITALGTDQLSTDMKTEFNKEFINTDLVFTSNERVPGLYLVQTDDAGERSFTYWREFAAARTVMNYFDNNVMEVILQGDMFFFSGISLAIIEPAARELFWQRLVQLKTAGVKIVFDPNYRARLWENAEQAKEQFEQAFVLSDILLPGIDDFNLLYNLNTFEQLHQFLMPYNIDEIIIKNGADSVISVMQNEIKKHIISPITEVVDTTSAGDSFNGTYLGAVLNGYSIAKAIALASKAASYVIQHKGAIVEKEQFNQFISPHLQHMN